MVLILGSIIDSLDIQLHHVPWEGFHALDLVFPLFIFIMGVAIPYSFIPKLEQGVTKTALYRKIFRRFVILVVFGIFYNQAWYVDWFPPRIMSVLGQIGFAYLFASIIFLNTKRISGIVLWMVGILVGVGLLQCFVPVPGFGPKVLTPEGSINAFLDQHITPGALLGDTFDHEGMLNNIAAITHALLGVLIGLILRGDYFPGKYRKCLFMFGTGVVLILFALLLKGYYPIVKNAHTSTFSLLTMGITLILMALFYLVVDVWRFRKWGFFFKVIGQNSITVYMAAMFIDFSYTSKMFLQGFANHMEGWGDVLIRVGVLVLIWYGLYSMYRRKVFLKI